MADESVEIEPDSKTGLTFKASNENTDEHLDYFRGELFGISSGLLLPFELKERANSEFAIDSFRVSAENKTDVMALMLSGVGLLLHRYTGDEELILGVTGNSIANPVETESAYPAILPVLSRNKSRQSYFRYFETLHKSIQELGEHAAGFEKFNQEWNQPAPGVESSPIQVLFSFPMKSLAGREEGTGQQEVDLVDPQNNFKLLFHFRHLGEEVECDIKYDAVRFEEGAIQNMKEHFRNILKFISTKSDAPTGNMSLLSSPEQLALKNWNNTEKTYPTDFLYDVFERQAKLTPDAPALFFNGDSYSFTYLLNRINRTAARLVELGVGPETPVGVNLERSPLIVVAMLGVFRAGGAYVPLDLSYPEEYFQHIRNETNLKVVITSEELKNTRPSEELQFVVLDAASEVTESVTTAPAIKPENLAVIMYTSGSTGVPKGVAMEHRQILNRFNWLWENYPLEKGEVACQRTTINFIPSIWEFLGPLLQGIPVHIFPDKIVKDTKKFIEMLGLQRVTRISVVPSLLQMILDTNDNLRELLPDLKLWFTAGEPLSAELYARFKEQLPDAILHNDYGATEVNGVVAFDSRWREGLLESVPIGRPIANARTYILDDYLNQVPLGVAGELYISGTPVSRGYINRTDLTVERFIPDPFSEEKGARMYNMGDVARFHKDGSIEVLGRKDNQVKILGKRVELNGIQKVLLKNPQIRECAVVAMDTISQTRQLVAFVVGVTKESPPSVKELNDYLNEYLADFMVPSHFVVMDELPRLPNGKVDRVSLRIFPVANRKYTPAGEGSYVAPRNEIEMSVAKIWKEVLQINEIGVNDGFFELGGNSALMLQLHLKLKEAFPREITIVDMAFKYPSISALAGYYLQDEGGEAGAPESKETVERNQRAEKRKRAGMDNRSKRIDSRRQSRN